MAIHGSKTQEEREYAIRSFKEGKKDVMVASGVASKVDFKLQHVEIGMLMDDHRDWTSTRFNTLSTSPCLKK